MNKTNRSNFTSLSFSVEDDLISEASISTYIPDKKFIKNPFSKNYPKNQIEHNHFNNDFTSNKQKKIIQKAQYDAYKQLNNQMFNPFQHKLNNGFIPNQLNLYEKQKQRQIQLIKKKQQQQVNNNRNYTIVFKNSNKNKSSLALAANNILNEEGYSIQDYYNQNIKKKKQQMKQIQEEQNNDQQNQEINKPRTQNSIKNSHKQINKMINLTKNPSNQKKSKPVQKRISIQQPKTSMQPKKPINNFINKPSQQKKPKQIIKKPTNNLPPRNSNNNKQLNKNSKQATKINKPKYSDSYQGADRNLVQQIQNQITQQTNITFQDIAQLQTAKSLLQQAIVLPRMMPQFFKGIRKAMKGILMFGPPGTGKTLLAKAVAHGNMFFNVSASSLASKWKGQSEKMVRILFQIARFHSPSIIFFDEIDAIASKRSQNQHQASRKVKTQLLVQMDGVQSSQNQVFVLAATNRPWDLDQALRRRLQKRIYIPLPQKQARRKMFEINLKQIKLNQKIRWDLIVKETQNYSGADISNICRDSAYMPMRRMIAKVGIQKMAQINQKQLLNQQLGQNDLIQAIKNNKPSVNLDQLKKYQKWMKQFGSQ